MRVKSLTLATSLLAVAGTVHGAPPAFQDARAFAMGGAGVAAGRPASASFYNPALLSVQHKNNQDDFNITLPSINGRFADYGDVVGQVDDLQHTIDAFNTAVAGYESGNGDIADVRTQASRLQSQLRAFDQDTMRADLGVGLALQKPGRKLGVAVFADSSLRAGARGDYAVADDRFLSDVIEASSGTSIPSLETDGISGRSLESSGRIVAAALSEVGLTLSRQFALGGNALALGVSPKFVELRTFDYERGVADFEEDEFDAGEYETRKSGFNMDLGAAYSFGRDSQWIAGVSVRNLLPLEVDTVNGDTVEITPQATIGLAHRSNWHTLAVDLDLTKNEAFSFEDDTQWLAVGGEIDVFNSLQLRAGVRHNLAHNSDASADIAEENQITAGIALSPFGIRIELGAMLADGSAGGAAELGFMF